MSRPFRKTVRGAGDDLRLGMRALKAAKSHLLSAAISHPCPGVIAERLRTLRVARIGDLIDELALISVDLDLIDARRRRERRRPPKRKAA